MSINYRIDEAHDLQFRVHLVLARSPYVGRRGIQCEIVDENIVILKGSVLTYYQKQMAQESLRKLEGIGRITNELAVAYSER
jgi:hypothetical protein